MKAVILGGNFVGRGAEAMSVVVASELRKRLPELRFVMMQSYSAAVPAWGKKIAEEYEIEFVPFGPRTAMDYVLLPVLRPLGLSYRHLLQYSRSVRQALAIMDVRGFVFIPDLGIRGINGIGYLVMSKIARAFRVKHVILPQVMGPFESRVQAWIARRSLAMATFVTARDPQTKSILEAIGVHKRTSLRLCPDIAFQFDPAPRERAAQILRDLGIGEVPFVAITPNIRIYDRSGPGHGGNAYLDGLTQVIRFISSELNLPILLVAHSVNDNRRDDRWVIERLMEQAGSVEGLYSMRGGFSAAEVKAVIGRSRMLLGSRYHSLIAALSLGVPCMAISWSHKYEELMNSVGLPEYCVSGRRLDASIVCRKLERLEEDREALIDRINQAVAGFRGDIERLFDDAAAVVEQAIQEESGVARTSAG